MSAEQVAELNRQREEEERKRKESADKAEKLLKENLDQEQQKEYEATKSFHVIGADGERYRVKPAWAGHIEKIVGGKAVERLCIHPDRQVPIADNQLIAKLMLETDPASARRIANVTRLTG